MSIDVPVAHAFAKVSSFKENNSFLAGKETRFAPIVVESNGASDKSVKDKVTWRRSRLRLLRMTLFLLLRITRWLPSLTLLQF